MSGFGNYDDDDDDDDYGDDDLLYSLLFCIVNIVLFVNVVVLVQRLPAGVYVA